MDVVWVVNNELQLCAAFLLNCKEGGEHKSSVIIVKIIGQYFAGLGSTRNSCRYLGVFLLLENTIILHKLFRNGYPIIYSVFYFQSSTTENGACPFISGKSKFPTLRCADVEREKFSCESFVELFITFRGCTFSLFWFILDRKKHPNVLCPPASWRGFVYYIQLSHPCRPNAKWIAGSTSIIQLTKRLTPVTPHPL